MNEKTPNKNEKTPNKRDECVSCGVETQYDEFEHIDFRYFYIEGVGQLCPECGKRLRTEG